PHAVRSCSRRNALRVADDSQYPLAFSQDDLQRAAIKLAYAPAGAPIFYRGWYYSAARDCRGNFLRTRSAMVGSGILCFPGNHLAVLPAKPPSRAASKTKTHHGD